MIWLHRIVPSEIYPNEYVELWEIRTETVKALIRLEYREDEDTGEDYKCYACSVSIPNYFKNGKPNGTSTGHRKAFKTLEEAQEFAEPFFDD